MLGNNSLATMARAADIAGIAQQLELPGTMLTLLAPSDAAFASALPALGMPHMQMPDGGASDALEGASLG